MNIVVLIGNLTRDVDLRYSQGEKSTAVAKFSIAVQRKFKQDGQPQADFINCTAFGKTAEMIEKNFHKGRKIAISGEWRTGSYTNKDGNKVYTNDCFVNSVYFVDSKNSSNQQAGSENPAPQNNGDGFMNIPDGIDEELPFN